MWLSAAVRRAVLDAGAPLSSGRVRYQGVDCSLFTPGPRARSAARPLTLLFVGRLHPSKGPDVALEALANVRSRGRAAELVIVGEADDPAYDAALRQQAAQLGVTAHVTWRGKLNREQLPDVYRSADVFLFVSRLAHEGQGLTYLEAMACGVPVVASPSGGAREFLTQYPIARLTAACDGVSFGDEILKIADDSVDTTRLAAAAMVTVREHASLDAYIDVIEQELSSMSCVTKH